MVLMLGDFFSRYLFTRYRKQLFLFVVGLFFLLLADSVMVYAFPIIVQNQLGSNTLLGIVLSFSSVVGVVCDFLLPQVFHKKQWRILFYFAVTMAATFPLFTDLGSSFKVVSFFLMGSAIWGIYYEFMQFSRQDFVVSQDETRSYALDWSVIFAMWQVNLIVGPILAAFILSKSYSLTPILVLFYVLSILSIFLIKDKKGSAAKTKVMKAKRASHIRFFKIYREFSYWKVLGGVMIWMLLLSFCLNLNQALFQTIGGVYGQQLFTHPLMQSAMVVLYNAAFIPAMIIAPFFHRRGCVCGFEDFAVVQDAKESEDSSRAIGKVGENLTRLELNKFPGAGYKPK